MSEYIEKINLPCDDDGYTLFKCPHCKEKFRLNNNDLIEEDITELFCPICGLSSNLNNFFTNEVINYAKGVASNMAIDIMNKELKKLERNSKGFIKVSKPIKRVPLPILHDNDDELVVVNFDCCDKTAKLLLIDKHVAYCPYCGVN